MPFTPFHFGLGYSTAGLEKRPRYFCFFAFVVTQVVIDIETLRNMLTGAPRLHTFFHTFLGSTIAALISVGVSVVLILLLRRALSFFPAALTKALDHYRLFPKVTPGALPLGISALFGAWSHVFLDSIMHSDVEPFAPFATGNPMEGVISLGMLHLICTALIGSGCFLVFTRKT